MTEYIVKKGDTLLSLAKTLGLPGAYSLKNFHNFKGPIERGIGNDITEGIILTIPEPHEVQAINQEHANIYNKAEEKKKDIQKSSLEESQQESEKEKKHEKTDKSADDHEGKKFVIQKGKAICDKGTKFPNFKVTSHKNNILTVKMMRVIISQ